MAQTGLTFHGIHRTSGVGSRGMGYFFSLYFSFSSPDHPPSPADDSDLENKMEFRFVFASNPLRVIAM